MADPEGGHGGTPPSKIDQKSWKINPFSTNFGLYTPSLTDHPGSAPEIWILVVITDLFTMVIITSWTIFFHIIIMLEYFTLYLGNTLQHVNAVLKSIPYTKIDILRL